MLFLLALFLLIPAVQAEDSLEWTTRGLAALDAGKYSDALTYFNNALAQDQKYASALSGKAVALNALRDYTGALDAADKALAIRSLDQQALNAKALALLRLQRYNESAVAYNNLFVFQINIPEAYCNQGYAYSMLNQTDAAVVSYKKCTTLDPQNFMVWNELGTVYMMQGDYTSALSAFDTATGITPKNATVWNNKGKAYAAQGKPADALQCFNKALGIDPDYTDAQYNKESMSGQLQSFRISETTVATPPTLNRLGTYYSTPTPQVTEMTPGNAPAPGTEITGEVPPETAAVVKKTTYSPLSPFTALFALVVLAGVMAIARRVR